MESVFVVFLVLAFALQCRGYDDDKIDTKLVQDHTDKKNEGIVTSSRIIIYEAANSQRPKEENFTEQHQNNPRVRKAAQVYLIPSEQTAINSGVNYGFNETFQQPFNNQQENFNINANQYNAVPPVHNAQNQFTDNSNYQPYEQLYSQQQQQAGLYTQITPPPPQPLSLPQQQQQQYPPQPYSYPEQSPCNSNLQGDSANTQNYVSQSEAAQLDMPYKQINNNPRPFIRLIGKCDVLGQCEPQNSVDCGTGGTDFHHQQVLKLSRAQIQPDAGKKSNYELMGNALTSIAAKEQKGIPVKKGTDIKDRRLFPYIEAVISQYPHN